MLLSSRPARPHISLAATLALTVIALPVLLSGCGGSSSGGSSSPSPRVATLYAGGDQSEGIDVFDIAANGSLRLRENFNSEQVLVDVRTMTLNPDGNRLVAGLQQSTGLQIFPVEPATGQLTDINVYLGIKSSDVTSHPELDMFYASRSGGLGTLHAVSAENVGSASEALLEIEDYDTTNNISSSVIHPTGDYIFVSHVDNASDPSEHLISMLSLDNAGQFSPPAAEEILVQDDISNPRVEAISPEGDMLIVASVNASSRVGFVTVNTATESLTLDTGPIMGAYRDAVFHPDGDWAYAVTSGGVITAYGIDRSAGEITQIGENLSDAPLDGGVGVIAISPDGTTLFSALGENITDGTPGQIAIIDIDQSDGSLSLRTTVDMNIASPLSLLAATTDVSS